MELPLAIGMALVILIAVIIICSVIVSGLQQNKLLQTARQQHDQQELTLSKYEADLLSEVRHYWLRDEILPVNAGGYKAILLPDRKLIITLNRPTSEASITKTGWLVLELTKTEVEQESQKTVSLIANYLQNPRQMNIQRLTMQSKD